MCLRLDCHVMNMRQVYETYIKGIMDDEDTALEERAQSVLDLLSGATEEDLTSFGESLEGPVALRVVVVVVIGSLIIMTVRSCSPAHSLACPHPLIPVHIIMMLIQADALWCVYDPMMLLQAPACRSCDHH